MNKTARIGVIGATGYVGVELLRLLAGHPCLRPVWLASQSYAGKRYSDIHPAFKRVIDLVLSPVDLDEAARNCDIVVTALPHGVSSQTVPQLLDRGLRVLDHSGDFRYRDVKTYERAYKLTHPCPDLLSEAVYGLPEIYRQRIAGARLVANPGCYPTASLLAMWPLLRAGVIRPDSVIIDAVSGISGAGRKADLVYSFCEADGSFKAYGLIGHRHASEIEQEFALAVGLDAPLPLSFTPHLAPLKRGMLVTAYAALKPEFDPAGLRGLYEQAYDDEYFVRLMPEGRSPETRDVAYSNFADVNVFHDARTGRVKALAAIDNLGKGAAAQAVQALNVMTGRPENEGLILAGGAV